jgi:single-strand DNA-binding protein
MNNVTIVGRLETDPVRKEVNGSVICTFRLASGRTRQRGGRLWIDIETWGAVAGSCYQHLTKGRNVLVSGRLVQREWSDPVTAERRWKHVVNAYDVEFLTQPEGRVA